MNSSVAIHIRGAPRPARASRGQSAVELALIIPVLIMILLAGADFGRLFYASIAVNNAAWAGAQYGAQNLTAAANPSGIETAALADGVNITGLTVPIKTQCTCKSGSTVTLCPANYCTYNSEATFVEVGTQAPFHTLVTYPGIPSSITLTGSAIMQVQQ